MRIVHFSNFLFESPDNQAEKKKHHLVETVWYKKWYNNYRPNAYYRFYSIYCENQVAARRVVSVSSEIKSIGCPTGTNAPIDNKAENPALSNRKKRSRLGTFMKPDHKRMARVIGYTLTVGGTDAWAGFSTATKARLTVEERAALAWAALRSLDTPEQSEQVAKAVLSFADYPLPSFLNPMPDARLWASWASAEELKAYALAAHDAMSARDQMAFRNHISEVEIAA